jgi:N-acetylglucosaminyldiphosphoundecaprenol N-acetyl-beta-D-mannosaminyltransferase
MSTVVDNGNIASPQKKIVLLGVKIDVLSVDQFLIAMQACLPNRQQSVFSYVNIHAVNIAYSLPWFRNFLNQSDITFCDGVGLKLAARLTRQGNLPRYTPPDFVERIFKIAEMSSWRLFLLGAKPETVEHVANRMMKQYPNLQIRFHHGYFDKTASGPENTRIVQQINQFKPHMLILGFGMPLQEKWIVENMLQLDVKMFLPSGALFDYLSSEIPRAPRWMTDHGLEWLGRLVIEPRRLWKRYVIGNPLFFWRIFIHHILRYPLPG